MPLEFTLNQAAPADTATDCIVVGAFSSGTPGEGTAASGAASGGARTTLGPAAQALDAASGGRLAAL
ncbi:hypothetical protein, partial [Cognatiluteimonas telluris]|uniref:hypothetical protein n=1 Tax=Cognatiluteimonas telluris TaxID=1104775 RepID=UPI00140D9B34